MSHQLTKKKKLVIIILYISQRSAILYIEIAHATAHTRR